MGQHALLLYVSCSALLVAPVPALLRGPKPALLLGFSLVVGISAAVNASVDGAPQVGWMTARQEQDITHRVFFDAYLKMK